MLADCTAHSAALPRLVLLYDLACSYHPLLRSRWRLCCLTDAAHPPCRCRSAHLVGVQPNSRLPPVPTMRRAQQCRYFASSLPPCYRHSRLTIVRRGCKRSRIAGIHGEAMYAALTLRSACSHSSYKLSMSGVEGPSPRLSLGDSKGVFSSKREYPLWCCDAHAAPPPALAREKGCSAAALRLNPLRPMGAKKEQPFRAA